MSQSLSLLFEKKTKNSNILDSTMLLNLKSSCFKNLWNLLVSWNYKCRLQKNAYWLWTESSYTLPHNVPLLLQNGDENLRSSLRRESITNLRLSRFATFQLPTLVGLSPASQMKISGVTVITDPLEWRISFLLFLGSPASQSALRGPTQQNGVPTHWIASHLASTHAFQRGLGCKSVGWSMAVRGENQWSSFNKAWAWHRISGTIIWYSNMKMEGFMQEIWLRVSVGHDVHAVNSYVLADCDWFTRERLFFFDNLAFFVRVLSTWKYQGQFHLMLKFLSM